MIKKLLLMLVLFCCIGNANAQNRMRAILKKKVAEACLTGGIGAYNGPYWGVGANLQYLWGIGRNAQHFRIGMGVREFSFFADSRYYFTSDPAVKNALKGGADSVHFGSMQSNVINSYLAFQYHIKRGIEFGLNMDMAGITFGTQKSGFFHSTELSPGNNIPITAQPVGFNTNAFLQSYAYGSSVNEAYFQFQCFNIMRFRVGATYFVNQIETTANPYSSSFGNTAKLFKNNNYMATFGVVWNVRHNRTFLEY